jgi:hypothetical protein
MPYSVLEHIIYHKMGIFTTFPHIFFNNIHFFFLVKSFFKIFFLKNMYGFQTDVLDVKNGERLR